MTSTEAIVLVGGLGTRLRPVVGDLPKPLAVVAGRPFLAWVLDHLARSGLRHVILAAGYRADEVRRVIGRRWQAMDIGYSVETTPLGTGGAVRAACELLHGDTVHVLNGDTFLDYDPEALAAGTFHAGASIGVALARVPDVARYGAVERGPDGIVVGFREKGQAGPGYVNAGCYFLGSDSIASLPEEASYSLEHAVLEPLSASGRVYGYTDTRGFIDIGIPEDYRRAQLEFAE